MTTTDATPLPASLGDAWTLDTGERGTVREILDLRPNGGRVWVGVDVRRTKEVERVFRPIDNTKE